MNDDDCDVVRAHLILQPRLDGKQQLSNKAETPPQGRHLTGTTGPETHLICLRNNLPACHERVVWVFLDEIDDLLVREELKDAIGCQHDQPIVDAEAMLCDFRLCEHSDSFAFHVAKRAGECAARVVTELRPDTRWIALLVKLVSERCVEVLMERLDAVNLSNTSATGFRSYRMIFCCII